MSGLVDRLQHRARILVYGKRFGKVWAKALADEAIYPPPGTTVDAKGQLIVPDLGTPVPDPNTLTLKALKAVRLLTDLHKRAGATFEFREKELQVAVGGVRAVAEEITDIHVFHEVFVERIYDFHHSGSFLCVDIGMNIGLASLFFAQRYQAEVHGFELIRSTADLAQRNLDLNPELAQRITLHRFGLADRDQEIGLRFSPQDRAGGSIFGSSDLTDATNISASVKDVAPVVSEIIEKLNNRELVLKIDAEGAEYEILERLDSQGLLAKARVLLLEWHPREGKAPEELRQRLKGNGFHWFERRHPEANVGLLSAFKAESG